MGNQRFNFNFCSLSDIAFSCSSEKFRLLPLFPDRNTHKGQSSRWHVVTSLYCQLEHSIHFARIACKGVRSFVTIPSFVWNVCLIAIFNLLTLLVRRRDTFFFSYFHPRMIDTRTLATDHPLGQRFGPFHFSALAAIYAVHIFTPCWLPSQAAPLLVWEGCLSGNGPSSSMSVGPF